MKLEEVTAVLRPRGSWEAADLGCALVRRHYPRAMLIWALTVLPLWALLLVLFHNNLVLVSVLIWFLQPLYGRAVLFHISRALFGSTPTIGEVMRAVPSLWMRAPIYSFTIGRLSFSRSFLLPVLLLERPKWSAFGSRAKTLKLQGDGATTLTMTTSLLFVCFAGALFGLFQLLSATGVAPDWQWMMEDFLANVYQALDDGELGSTVLLWGLILHMAAVSFIEPFYIGAGFGQYLDARTHLEGWVVELGFKRLAARLERLREGGGAIKAAILAGGFLLCLWGEPALGYIDAGAPEDVAAEVLADEDFEIHRETVSRFVSDTSGDSGSSGGFSGVEMIGQLLFWVILVAAIAGLVFLIYSNRHIFAGRGPAVSDAAVPKARTVMGMDIAEETLPDDIPGAAWEAFRAGDVGRAMRLLYRGSISWMVEREGLPVLESDTEGDCVKHSTSMADPERVLFFGTMTEVWTAFAYGESRPPEDEFGALCKRWPYGRGKGGEE